MNKLNVGDTMGLRGPYGNSFPIEQMKGKNVVFIAGGIGITPFRRMLQYLLDTKQKRNIVLLYSNKTAADVAYKPVMDRAQAELGIKTLYALSNEKAQVPGMFNGSIDAGLIAQNDELNDLVVILARQQLIIFHYQFRLAVIANGFLNLLIGQFGSATRHG